jgi:hypothetical protein
VFGRREKIVNEILRDQNRTLQDEVQNSRLNAMHQLSIANQKILDLERMNAQLQSQVNWMQLRLNHVELERAQLIQAAIGVKTSVPQFVPAQDNPEEAFNGLPDLSNVGGDAKEDDNGKRSQAEIEETGSVDPAVGIDYTNLPGYARQR